MVTFTGGVVEVDAVPSGGGAFTNPVAATVVPFLDPGNPVGSAILQRARFAHLWRICVQATSRQRACYTQTVVHRSHGRRSTRRLLGAAVAVSLSACSLAVDLGGLSSGAPVVAPGRPDAATEGGEPDAGVPRPDGGVVACRTGFTGGDCSTPCPASTAGPSCDFRLALALDIPVSGRWVAQGDVPYAVNRTASLGSFARVAYVLRLDAEEVWVELDAFTTDPTLLGVPVDRVFDVPASNMVVHSFAARQPDVLVPTAGSLELWSNCYDEGPNGVFDSDDTIAGAEPDCYGSMQFHVAGSPVIAFNRWASGDAYDLGIGRSDTGQPDWTFAKNGASFEKRRLEVYVR